MVPLADLSVRAAGTGTGAGAGADWLLRATPRFDGDGQFAGYLGTARPRTPGALHAAGAAPGGDAGDGAEALSEQAAFSYTVTHDLRAPIRVVEGFTRILKEDYGRLLDRVGNDHLDRVLGGCGAHEPA